MPPACSPPPAAFFASYSLFLCALYHLSSGSAPLNRCPRWCMCVCQAAWRCGSAPCASCRVGPKGRMAAAVPCQGFVLVWRAGCPGCRADGKDAPCRGCAAARRLHGCWITPPALLCCPPGPAVQAASGGAWPWHWHWGSPSWHPRGAASAGRPPRPAGPTPHRNLQHARPLALSEPGLCTRVMAALDPAASRLLEHRNVAARFPLFQALCQCMTLPPTSLQQPGGTG